MDDLSLQTYTSGLSPEGAPQVSSGARSETYPLQKSARLNALDAIVRAACLAVADGHERARILYHPAQEAVAPLLAAEAPLPADAAEAGLRKTFDLAARRVCLELKPIGKEPHHG